MQRIFHLFIRRELPEKFNKTKKEIKVNENQKKQFGLFDDYRVKRFSHTCKVITRQINGKNNLTQEA